MIDRERVAGALRRLGAGGVIASLCSLVLIALTFCKWYGDQVSGPNNLLILTFLVDGGTAWQKLGAIAYFLALAAAITLVAAMIRLVGSRRTPKIPFGVGVGVLGLAAAGLIAMRIIWPPGVDRLPNPYIGYLPIEKSVEVAPYLALVAALGVAFGGWWTARHESRVAAPRLDLAP